MRSFHWDSSVRGDVSSGNLSTEESPVLLHHIAFHVENRHTVDQLYEQFVQQDMQIVHAPRLYPEYCEDYYAFFFKDSEGIELEITSYERKKYFP